MIVGSNVGSFNPKQPSANIVKVLPEGHSIISATGHGASHWSQSGKIDVRLADGDPASYFIKVKLLPRLRLYQQTEFTLSTAVIW